MAMNPGGRRLLRGTAIAVLVSAAAVFSVSASVVVHANLPLTRRVVARLSGTALTGLLGGKVTMDPLSEILPSRLSVPRMTLSDAYGTDVLVLHDVRLDVSLQLLVEELVLHASRPTIIVNHLRVEQADVTLVADPKTGEPTIVHALSPKATAGASPPTADAGPGFRLYFPAIEIGHVAAQARLAEQRPFEADLHQVQGLLLVTPKGLAVDVKRFGMALRGLGQDARGTGTLAVRAPGPVRATFDGFYGDIELRASGFLEGTHVDASVDAPRVSPRAGNALLRGWPLTADASGHLDVTGELPELSVTAKLVVGEATLDAKGNVSLRPPEHGAFEFRGEGLDARLLAEDAPETSVTTTGKVTWQMEGDSPSFTVTAHTEPTALLGQLVPATDVQATWKDGATRGTASIHEPGVPLTASFEVSPNGAADVNADSGAFDFSRLPRLPIVGLHGAGHARMTAHVEGGQLRGTVDGDVRGFDTGGFRLSHARVAGTVTVPLGEPSKAQGAIHVTGEDAAAGTLTAKHLVVDARGGPSRLAFDAHADDGTTTEIGAKGMLFLEQRVVVRDTTVSLRRDPVLIEGKLAEFDPEQGKIDVRDIHVSGAGGTLTGSARLGRDLVEIEAEGQNIDLAALGKALGLPRGVLEGTLRVSASVATGHDVTRGRVRLGLGNATIGAVGGVYADVSADLEDRRLQGEASGLVSGLGTFGTTWKGELAGPAFEVASWERITGEADVQVGNVRLPVLSLLIPKDAPVSHVGGLAFSSVRLARKSEQDRFPEVFGTIQTQDLTVDVRREGRDDLHVAGIDVTATGSISGVTGDSTGTTLLADRKGTLLTGSGAIKIDFDRFLQNPAAALSQLVDTPLDLILSAPPRALSDLPELVRPSGLSGIVSANASVKGTLSRPTLFVALDGVGLGSEDALLSRPVDAHASGQYEWNTREASGRGTLSVDAREAAAMTFHGVLPAGPFRDWTGEGHVDLSALPLDLASTEGKTKVGGTASGTASFRRGGTAGELSADLRLDGLTIDDSPLGSGSFVLRTDGSAVTAKLGLRGERGRLDADATTNVVWDSGVPAVPIEAPLSAHLVAREFSAAALAPFVRPALARVSGRLDADLTATFPPHSREGTGASRNPALGKFGIDGTATLSEGAALVETLGLDVRELTASVTARGDGGETKIAVRDLDGRVRSSHDNIHGSADLVLSGLRLTSGTGELSTHDVPVLFRGAPQGRVTGSASFRLSRDEELYVIVADVPNLVAVLPESQARDVIDLEDNPDISIVQLAREEEQTGSRANFHITVILGSGVRLRRSHVDLGVTGSPVVRLGNEVAVDGSIDVTSGSAVQVLGKPFSIDHGRVIFDTGVPQNPRLDVTATWRSPSDTTVIVEVTGTLDQPQISMRSDPPLPESEVAALVLGSGTNIAAQSLTQLVSDNPIELRVESTAEARPRYTAAVPVRENLWFEASTYQQSQMSPSATGTDRSVYTGTIDYRFSPRWSLRTEAGTAGGALDLLWQYRY